MASLPLRTGLAITLALGLLAFAPLHGFARGSNGQSSGFPSHSYSSGHTFRSPTASSRGSINCLTCERDSSGRTKRDRSAVEDFKWMYPKPP